MRRPRKYLPHRYVAARYRRGRVFTGALSRARQPSTLPAFRITEHARAQLRWETFNITNSVRYDVHTIGNHLDQPTPFGKYTQTLTNPRAMQAALRLEF